jgi:PAS domain S-box-containing protein
MKFLKIKQKTIFTIIIFILICVTAILIYLFYLKIQTTDKHPCRKDATKYIIENIINNSSKKSEEITSIYSENDETLIFISNKEKEDAQKYFKKLITDHKFSYSYIYDNNFNQIYSGIDSSLKNKNYEIEKDILKKCFSKSEKFHFFLTKEKEIFEIFGEKIESKSNKLDNKTINSQYFVNIKNWNSGYLKELEDLTGIEITYTEYSNTDYNIFHKILYDYNQSPIILLKFKLPEYSERRSEIYALFIIIALIALMIILIIALLFLKEKAIDEKSKTQSNLSINNSENDEILKISNNLLFNAIEQAPITIIITDNNGYIKYVNKAFTSTSGYKPDEILGKNPRILQSGKTNSKIYDELWETIIAGNTWKGEIYNKKKNGQIYIDESIITPIKDLSGNITNFIAFKTDITIQKETEQVLITSELKYKNLINFAPDAFFHGDEKGNFIFVNDRAVSISEFSEDELLKMNMKNLFTESELNKKPLSYDLLNLGETVINEREILTKNKKKIIIEMNSKKMPDGTYQSFLRDITERKLSEIALKESEEKLRQLNATKDKFFGIISHDLRSPFNAILGFADILRNSDAGIDTETTKKFANNIYEASYNAFKLLENLLEWSRIQMKKIVFSPENVNFSFLLEEILLIVKPQITNKKISILRGINSFETLTADYNMLQSIMRNLITNAIKFSNIDGEITISAEKINNEIIISVKDNGIGISAENQLKLWNLSEQFTNKGTLNEQGTGLGLLLCKELVEKHGGKIWVESEIDKGCCFKFTLPQ